MLGYMRMLMRNCLLFAIALFQLVGTARGEDYKRVLIRNTPDGTQDTCYLTARNVYVEALVGNKWVERFWGANAQYPVNYERREDIQAFRLSLDGHELPANWTLISQGEAKIARTGTVHYVVELLHADRPIRVRLHTELDGTPILKRWLEIINEGDESVSLTDVAIWPSWMQAQKHYGADENPPRQIKNAFDLGYYTRGWHTWEGWFTWESLEPGIKTVGCNLGQCYNSPFFIARNNFAGEYLIGALGWSANWRLKTEFISGRVTDDLNFSIEPTSNAALRVISPGENVETPAVHMGRMAGDLDATVQAMHAHVRKSVIPQGLDPERRFRFQYSVPGDQGYLSPNFGNPKGCTIENMLKQVDIAAEMGAELFIMDAGWLKTAGTWEVVLERFPDGLDPLIDYVHKKGMLFGLYAELEKAHVGSKTYEAHPEWFKWYEGRHPIIDLSIPEAAQWWEAEFCRLVEDFRLDLFRIDFNIPSMTPFEGLAIARDGKPENNYWRYYDKQLEILKRIRAKYPKLILQQAACGGGRNDLMTASAWHEDYLTDGLRMPYELQNFSGQTLMLPPEVILIAHGADARGVTGFMENFESYLRTMFTLSTPWVFAGMTGPSVEEMSPERLELFRKYGELYKNFIRPILPTARVFHHGPVTSKGGVESSPWFAMEFTAPSRDKGWVTIVRIGESDSDHFVFRPRGLDIGKRYQVTVDSTGDTFEIEGAKLASDGWPVRLETMGMSELLLLQAK